MYFLLCLALSCTAFELPLELLQDTSLASSVSAPLRSFYNMEYAVKLGLGTPPQYFQLAIDLTSISVLVSDSKCVGKCTTAASFNVSKSTSYSDLNETTNARLEFVSGKATLGTDVVTLPFGEKVQEQRITRLLYNNATWIFDSDGYLGLAPFIGYKDTSSLISNMREQGLIDHVAFAIYLSLEPMLRQSAISFGSWDLQKYSSAQKFTFVSVGSNIPLWRLRLSKVTLEDIVLMNSLSPAFMHSTVPFIVCPPDVFLRIRSFFCLKHECDPSSTFIIFPCSSGITDFPDFEFTIDSHTFSLEAKFYIMSIEGMCAVLFYSKPGLSFWIFGQPFMRAFYTLYDAEFGRIGFAPSIDSTPRTSKRLYIILIAAALVLILAILGFLLYQRRKTRSNQSEALLSQS